MSDLFEPQRQKLREAMIKRGWAQMGATSMRGQIFWRRPDTALVEEDEAFRQMERILKEEEKSCAQARNERATDSPVVDHHTQLAPEQTQQSAPEALGGQGPDEGS